MLIRPLELDAVLHSEAEVPPPLEEDEEPLELPLLELLLEAPELLLEALELLSMPSDEQATKAERATAMAAQAVSCFILNFCMMCSLLPGLSPLLDIQRQDKSVLAPDIIGAKIVIEVVCLWLFC